MGKLRTESSKSSTSEEKFSVIFEESQEGGVELCEQATRFSHLESLVQHSTCKVAVIALPVRRPAAAWQEDRCFSKTHSTTDNSNIEKVDDDLLSYFLAFKDDKTGDKSRNVGQKCVQQRLIVT
ncbi:hypothetical protein AXG93_2884s1170 [Marchantia polymorpha subsp. ruderalis]|uniref:Uncharacterized protein n=1 Tax=Marchantia polymorpha subsp. ruderalis TaxID=1480154 RepID=A0A176WLK7_MARPO|nr:hypothetical protein AXG93_2884s1170 [Marchantia polymorpha subsp. ruderalis]